ncbi:twin-arginine translocase subunit TatC [Candidatus Desulforudis audaxviator]|uniref:Sec-independent protein translocase protein TatC n=1 Tax=Desulforudis audaxviator (strain MP104C) TaxID=477974 RepID=B1I3Q8_DESAP|nr:twin-arginine translocase subunit TatC [Candidatus Desulforudis audaxviator]ACA59631.1 Sec-independent protein translocase, TatC subunit [Candidatus Desulforudis audaxviator MP104C]AZK59621.1 Twin-arginine translocation protein TatC [Candidatus Desulforudis audaxviator]
MVDISDKEMSVVEHLHELRRVFLVSIVAVVVFAIAFFFARDFFLGIVKEPVASLGYDLQFLGVTEPVMTYFRLSLYLGFLAALPIILWQVWSFILPALKRDERKYFTIFVVLSYLAFIGGVAFSFFVVYRLGVQFLLRFAGEELMPMLTLANYVSFTIKFTLPFGLVAQLPLAAYLLAKLGVVTRAFMIKIRKHALLVIVIVSAMLTPADLLTCLLLATPMYSLFELSILIVGMVEKRKAKAREKAEREAEAAETA